MAQKQRQWQTKRIFKPKAEGLEYWDQAYQLLLQIPQQKTEIKKAKEAPNESS